MLNDIFYMEQALSEAQKAYSVGEVPIGAVLVDGQGNIVSCGHNMRENWKDATAHAEMIAIREACAKLGRWRLQGMSLYVTIEPCPMCAGAIVMSRLDRVVYGGTDSKAGAMESLFNIPGNPGLNHHIEVRAGVCEAQCRAMVQQFFSACRKNGSFQSKNESI